MPKPEARMVPRPLWGTVGRGKWGVVKQGGRLPSFLGHDPA